MICFFCVNGRHFDVDAFLADSPWRSRAEIHRKGDPFGLVGQKVLKRNRWTESGFQIALGPGGRDGKIDGQVKQAIQFLRRFEKEIQRLSEFKVDRKTLHFGVLWEERIVAKTQTFPAPLLNLSGAANVDILLSNYLS